MLFILTNVLIIGLFLYSKLLPHKDKLDGQYKGMFVFFSNIFEPILNFMRGFIKNAQVGQGLQVDMTQIVLLIILLLLAKFL
jgi:YGGT family